MATLLVHRSCGPSVLVVKATKDWHRDSLGIRVLLQGSSCSGWNSLSDSLVRPPGVEVRHVLAKHEVEMAFAEDDHMVQALPPNAAEIPLAHSIRVRCRLRSIRPMRQDIFESLIHSTHMLDASSALSRGVTTGLRTGSTSTTMRRSSGRSRHTGPAWSAKTPP